MKMIVIVIHVNIIHLLVANEQLAGRLLSIHNIRFLIKLTEDLREAIKNDNILEYKEKFLNEYGRNK